MAHNNPDASGIDRVWVAIQNAAKTLLKPMGHKQDSEAVGVVWGSNPTMAILKISHLFFALCKWQME